MTTEKVKIFIGSAIDWVLDNQIDCWLVSFGILISIPMFWSPWLLASTIIGSIYIGFRQNDGEEVEAIFVAIAALLVFLITLGYSLATKKETTRYDRPVQIKEILDDGNAVLDDGNKTSTYNISKEGIIGFMNGECSKMVTVTFEALNGNYSETKEFLDCEEK